MPAGCHLTGQLAGLVAARQRGGERERRPVEGVTPAMVGVVPAAVAVSLTGSVATTPVVAACLLGRCRTAQMVTATVISRRLVRPIPPGRLTRPCVARRGRVPGGARSSDRLGRTSGSRERLHPRMALRWRSLERADAVAFGFILRPHSEHSCPLVAKTTAPTFVATKWHVCPFCALGWHHRNGSQAGRVASLRNLNWEALQHASVRGMYGIRATCCRRAKS